MLAMISEIFGARYSTYGAEKSCESKFFILPPFFFPPPINTSSTTNTATSTRILSQLILQFYNFF